METSGVITIPGEKAKRLYDFGGDNAVNAFVLATIVMEIGKEKLPMVTVTVTRAQNQIQARNSAEMPLVVKWTLGEGVVN